MKQVILIVVMMTTLIGCAGAAYSRQAHERVLDIRIKTLRLLDKAVIKNSAVVHKGEMAAMRAQYAKAITAEEERDEKAAAIWKRISGQAGRAFALWEKSVKLSIRFVNAKKKQLDHEFHKLVELEKGKEGAPK